MNLITFQICNYFIALIHGGKISANDTLNFECAGTRQSEQCARGICRCYAILTKTTVFCCDVVSDGHINEGGVQLNTSFPGSTPMSSTAVGGGNGAIIVGKLILSVKIKGNYNYNYLR